jgi:leucyl aminopeptidase
LQFTDVRPTAVEFDPDGPLAQGADALALPVWPGDDGAPWLGPGGPELVDALGVDLFDALDRESASGKAGEVVVVPGGSDIQRVLLVGVGDGSAQAYRRAGAALARNTRGLERLASTVTIAAADDELRAFIEGAVLSTYAWRLRNGGKGPVGTIVLAGTDPQRASAVERGVAVGGAGWLGRDLVHTPANIKSPQWLADRARDVAADSGLKVRVWDEKKLAAEGFGGIVGVGQGSDRPPRLIELSYTPSDAAADTPHVVLVGKGITFDTGGLSLKPREAMVPMKTDMSGGAVVIAVLSALASVGCPVRVTGLVPAAENMPSGSAQRPSDVIRQYDGTSVEVLNTDAEGRLVLADAMGYAVAELAPDVIVDVATLTGAATMGLGRRHAAMYSTSDALAVALRDAGEAAGEKLWRMPLVDDYRDALESQVADVAHIETRKVGGGSITAALFLERFAGDLPWAHLDIAGPGRSDGDSHEVVKGGTAFGIRALLYWLETATPVPAVE